MGLGLTRWVVCVFDDRGVPPVPCRVRDGNAMAQQAAVDKHHANTKVLIKTAFFLAALPEAYPAFARHAAEAGLVGTFVNEVKKSSDGTLWECVLRLLANLCGAHGSCVLELQKEELNVDGLLGNRCGSIEQLDAEDRPAHAEELSYIAQLRAFLASEVDLRAEEDTGAVGGADGSMQLMTVEGSGAAAIPGSGPTDNSQKVDFEVNTLCGGAAAGVPRACAHGATPSHQAAPSCALSL